jgi:heavy metal sensor kinase
VNRRSIGFRLAACYAGILALTFAVVGIGVWVALRGSIDDTVDKELRAEVRGIRAFLAPDGGAGSAGKLMERAASTPIAAQFRIADGSGRWLYRSAGTEGWNVAAPDPARLPSRGKGETVTVGGKAIRILSAAMPPGSVQVGIPVDEFSEMLDAFTWSALLASPALLLLASAGGYWMSRRALAPVERITRTAAEIQAENLSARLPLSGTGDELDHLSDTLNAMLARLDDSFRRITQFTADASHELRTPVAIIRTTAEVTRRKPRGDKEYAEALDRILAESERTTQLIEDLMLLARADADAEELPPEPVRLDELALSACADARVLAEAAGMVQSADGLTPCTVSGDRRALRRLVLILLDNAIKYSNPGGHVRLGVSLYARGNERRAVLSVQDTGVGIAPEDLPHVFERFYRASKDRSRKIDGVGLGLSIARTIARRHGGEIEVESRPGAGSTFRVFLPAAE